MIAAFCPRCGGVTMVHGDPSSSTGREWTSLARATGDVIMLMRDTVALGPGCPSDVRLAKDRDCGVESRQETE